MRKKTDSNGKWGREQTVMKNKTVAVREAVTEQETPTHPVPGTGTQQAQTHPAAAGRIVHQKMKYFI